MIGQKRCLILIGEMKCDQCEKKLNERWVWTAEIHTEVYFSLCVDCRDVDEKYRIEKKYDKLEYELYRMVMWNNPQFLGLFRPYPEKRAEPWHDYMIANDWLKEHLGFDMEPDPIDEQLAKDLAKAVKLNLVICGYIKEDWTSRDNPEGKRTLAECLPEIASIDKDADPIPEGGYEEF